MAFDHLAQEKLLYSRWGPLHTLYLQLILPKAVGKAYILISGGLMDSNGARYRIHYSLWMSTVADRDKQRPRTGYYQKPAREKKYEKAEVDVQIQ